MTYQGSCHCGAVTFRVEADLSQTATCNCSMCQRAGWIMTFVPASQFTLLSGKDHLSMYHFNKRIIDHVFCNVCGIKPFGRGKDEKGNETVAVNVRCLEGVDVESLSPTRYHGKDL